MKNFLPILTLALCGFPGTTFADDFKSEVIPSNGFCSACPIRVHGDQFMVIRNFTQENGTMRGVVMVTQLPGSTPVNVLTAAILNTSAPPPPEVINNVVIAGPADVTVMCGTTTGNCFISYKKDSN